MIDLPRPPTPIRALGRINKAMPEILLTQACASGGKVGHDVEKLFSAADVIYSPTVADRPSRAVAFQVASIPRTIQKLAGLYGSDARLVALATPKRPGVSTFPAGVTSDPGGPIINVVGMLVVRGNGAVCGWVPIPD